MLNLRKLRLVGNDWLTDPRTVLAPKLSPFPSLSQMHDAGELSDRI
jgi:hypothetical protein